MALGEAFPDKLTLGMEIRDKLVDFVGLRIRSYRNEHNYEKYNNVSVLRTNVMRHVSTYFRKGSLEKMFFCFADPHFKKSKHRRRIINTGFLTEYAFLIKQGGRIYAITDVEDLHNW
jgi:tRNA (guanine-N7-)-methyltransferase